MKLATAAESRAIDKRAAEEYAIPSLLLMENAARSIADEIERRYGRGKMFVALCGPGNNGGDGLAVARHLTCRFEWSGSVVQISVDGAKPAPDRDQNFKMLQEMGLPFIAPHAHELPRLLERADIVIDALLGTGAHGSPRPGFIEAIELMNCHAEGRIVAIDVPSGVDVDTGKVGNPAIKAALTITLAVSKIGLHLAPAYERTGEIAIGDLCIPPEIAAENPALKALLTEPQDVGAWLPPRNQKRDTNKSAFGAIVLLAGSQGFAGAATLCCKGAIRAGAGLVTLGIPEGMLDVMMARLPDVVMTRGFLDTGSRQFRASAVPDALKFVEDKDAVGIGPGIGHQDVEIQGFVKEFVAQCSAPMTLDADALTILSQEPDRGLSLIRRRKAPTLLTPHPGEMARLLGISSKDVQADRLGSVRRAAEIMQCLVLLKGDRTLIAAPNGRLAVNVTGNAGMASGGMGDTLTGIATAFLAQIGDSFHAAAAAAYVHGLAGDMAAEKSGKAGLTASDLDEFIPAAIRHCREKAIG